MSHPFLPAYLRVEGYRISPKLSWRPCSRARQGVEERELGMPPPAGAVGYKVAYAGPKRQLWLRVTRSVRSDVLVAAPARAWRSCALGVPPPAGAVGYKAANLLAVPALSNGHHAPAAKGPGRHS